MLPEHKMRMWLWIVSVVCCAALSPFLTRPALAQGPNLLQNPGFELPHVQSIPGKENCFLAAPWSAWWVSKTGWERDQCYHLAPEYKGATRADVPGNRVRNGDFSQQWFHSYGSFEAGILQQVPNIQVGSKLKFELWVLTWSCDKESKGNCGGATSGDPSPMHVRIGIDPTGGGDVFGSAVAWSPEGNAWDTWTHFEVEAVAQNSTVTVYVYSDPDYCSQDNNVYVDDASLVALSPPPTATRRPTSTPTATPVATETPLPTATPVATATPVPTCPPTMVAQTVPTCPACPPTEVPKPVPTCPPVVIPTSAPVSLLSQLTSGGGWMVSLAALLAVIGAFAIGFATGKRK
jgi:hypothetical protein